MKKRWGGWTWGSGAPRWAERGQYSWTCSLHHGSPACLGSLPAPTLLLRRLPCPSRGFLAESNEHSGALTALSVCSPARTSRTQRPGDAAAAKPRNHPGRRARCTQGPGQAGGQTGPVSETGSQVPAGRSGALDDRVRKQTWLPLGSLLPRTLGLRLLLSPLCQAQEGWGGWGDG